MTTNLPSFAEAFRVWLRIGCLSFGGPAGQIALMHREVVEERRWVSDARFLHALNFCTLLPGPEAMQLATYLGWLMHGVRGGVAAGLLFVLPGALVLLALSLVYAAFGDVPVVSALFLGLKSAVLVLVIEALLKVGRRALKGGVAWGTALAAFLALFLGGVPFPVVVLAAGLLGLAFPQAFAPAAHGKAGQGADSLLDTHLAANPGYIAGLAPGARRAGLVALAMWIWPVVLLRESGGVYGDVAWFFSKMALVTFGGAYAVLAYVAQEAVEHYRWLTAPEMLAGLGLAETTPGPLILVLQFVGFLAGLRLGGGYGGAVAASALTLWVTFLPCFAWIFLGAPFVERLHGVERLKGALAAVTAAVVGVIGNLAVWFALRVLFAELRPGILGVEWPVGASLQWLPLALAIMSAFTLLWRKTGVLPVLALSAGFGLAARLAGLA
ncbi:chromate transporter [Rhodovarius crocodyli]|uniref:Chromate transporter n=1 Tax=Rhodovarius crocodyli TaxID=1979269 RepID=A0A437MJL6_9PROT|nr:chromate transporter [Rhodovarius crocodyli]RVT97840.1 chromate transporter [Rhodovarius crocodyli]